MKQMGTYWNNAINLVVSLSTLAILLAGDGLTPAIGLILLSLRATMELFSSATTSEEKTCLWVLYAFLSLHGFYASGHHTSLANIPW